MGYEVTIEHHRDMRAVLDEWLGAADQLMSELVDADSVRYRQLVALGSLASTASLSVVKKYASDVRAICAHSPAGSLAGGLAALAAGVRDLEATGLLAAPSDEDESAEAKRWWEELGTVHGAVEVIGAASLALATTYATLVDCRKIIGQIKSAGDTNELWVLRYDGEPRAVAACRLGPQEVIVADLVASPRFLGQGAGSKLMEWMVREAKALNGRVSLIALGAGVEATYARWGCVKTGTGMEMRQPAINDFLVRHTEFASTFRSKVTST